MTFYEYVKSKQKEIEEEMNLIGTTDIGETACENKVIIHYINPFSSEKFNLEEGLKYLIVKNSRSIDVFMTFGKIYAPISNIADYLQEGRRLKKLFSIKEYKQKADTANVD